MKLLILFFAILNVSNALDCKYCKSGITTIFDYATQESAIQGQIQFLTQQVCPEFESPQGCKQGVENWWPAMNHIIFDYKDIPYICKAWNHDCELFKEWNCDVCISQIQGFAGLWLEDWLINNFVASLQDVKFCEGMNLPPEELQFCKDMVEQFIPLAFKALFGDLQGYDQAQAFCHDVFDEICDFPTFQNNLN